MEEKKYSKRMLRNADIYSEYKDVLQVVLDDDKQYTMDEAERLISEFMEREAN